jgi:4-alpha-glucanotransferase
MRAGAIAPGQFDIGEYEYHLYAQWLMDAQLRGLSGRLRDQGVALYLDLPIGSHPEGFDAWRHQPLYAATCNVGAPPDGFFAGGQDWGFRPMLPGDLRRARYAPLIESLRHHMAVAGVLRIDHIMGLHRLFWVPRGLGAREGVYVRYPARELYAVLCLESHRHGVPIVGEDLGTVPVVVRREMARHGLSGMYVVQTELRDSGPPLRRPPVRSVASLNTHDMPTFAAFWDAAPSRARKQLGLVAGCQAATNPAAMAAALNRWLASSGAAAVLVNPDDLWGEFEPQNVPGTSVERPNWRRRLRYSIEELESVAAVRALGDLTTLRKRGNR